MQLLTFLDYSAEVLHLCYILLTALFRFTVKAAVAAYVIGQYVSEYYHQLSEMTFTLPLQHTNVRLHPALLR